jgi:hypothetical protein
MILIANFVFIRGINGFSVQNQSIFNIDLLEREPPDLTRKEIPIQTSLFPLAL